MSRFCKEFEQQIEVDGQRKPQSTANFSVDKPRKHHFAEIYGGPAICDIFFNATEPVISYGSDYLETSGDYE